MNRFIIPLSAISIVILAGLTPRALAAPATGPKASPVPAVEVLNGEVGFTSACSNYEKWRLPNFLSKEDSAFFLKFLKKEIPPIQGFSQGLALRQFGSNEEAQIFGEYWISRSLFEAKLLHGAWSGFSTILNRTPNSTTAPYHLAALECIFKTQSRYPSLEVTDELIQQITRLAPFASTSHAKNVIWEAAGAAVRTLVARNGVKPDQFNSLLSALKGGGAHELLAKGLVAARFGNHSKATNELDAFLLMTSVPDSLKRFQDHGHILAARAYYSLHRYPQSVEHLKLVRKASNELADTLSELSWAQLMDFHYDEAIGTAMNLQAGGLRRTFAPEGPMVMAMAMNEICQFPDSVRSIRIFQKNYEPSHRWLSQWSDQAGPLYPQAVDFLRKTSKVPDRIGSEWVRSPIFISHQDELNLLVDEKDSGGKVTRSGSELQLKMASDILAFLKELKPRLNAAKNRQKAGESIPKALLQDIDLLKRQVVDLRRLQRAAPVWLKILSTQIARAPARKAQLIASVNKDLSARTHRMVLQLEEISENIQLIEVEIYNGATHDIIWQNAHPDYKAMAEKLKDDTQRNEAKTWNWGKMSASAEEEGEIWEDELGSFKANLYDNCSSKDRYLALMKGKR